MCDNDKLSLDERMHQAGMMPVSEMLDRTAMDQFHEHALVKDLGSFEEWMQITRESFIKMQARMMLDKKDDDELFEWVVAHNAVLGTVMANFRKATGK